MAASYVLQLQTGRAHATLATSRPGLELRLCGSIPSSRENRTSHQICPGLGLVQPTKQPQFPSLGNGYTGNSSQHQGQLLPLGENLLLARTSLA